MHSIKALACVICSSLMEDPYILRCGHCVCSSCQKGKDYLKCLRCDRWLKNRYQNLVLRDISLALRQGQSIEKLLECSICLRTLSEPTCLRCGHTFCYECITRCIFVLCNISCSMCRMRMSKFYPNKGVTQIIKLHQKGALMVEEPKA